MNFYQAALLVTLLGMVGSAPLLSDKLIMDQNTIQQAHSIISKILEDIPPAHASWITSETLALDSSGDELQYLKDSLIPSAPVLKNISENFTLEICLDHIVKGLKLHQNLLKEISNATTLPQSDPVDELKAGIQELLFLINKLQNEAGFARSLQASDEQLQASTQHLAKKLTTHYVTQVAAHLTLQQLRDFSCDVIRSIRSLRGVTSEEPDAVTQCVNIAGQ